MNIEKEFKDLIEVIEDAGKIAYEYFDSEGSENTQKEDGSVVTQIDTSIETILLKHISERFPDDAVVGEEHGNRDGTSGFVWHIDPIDGTENLVRKIPFSGISVARLGDTSENSFGIIHNPFTGQTFASLMENGAYENEKICTLTADTIGGRLYVAIGASSSKEVWMKSLRYELSKQLAGKFGKSAALGCTALELAYVAAGRIDGFLTYGLYSYDYAAGLFLVKAAGGKISVFEEGVWSVWEKSLKELCADHGRIIFVSHPDVHDEIRDFIGDPKQWADT